MIDITDFWWLVFPIGGLVGGSARAIADRRADTRAAARADSEKLALTQSAAASDRRKINQLIQQHTDTDNRWMDYEMDIAKLLDFPLMTDMRAPLTAAFHQARSHADLLRPATADDMVSDRDAQHEYRTAVHDYMTAFGLAEADAIRRRRSDFSSDDQARMHRAQSLLRVADDDAATPEERRNAYSKAKRELDGIIALPAKIRASIEQRIAGQIEA